MGEVQRIPRRIWKRPARRYGASARPNAERGAMKVSCAPWSRAVWPFGKGAMIVWQKERSRTRLNGARAVNIPIEDATPRHEPVMVREILSDLRLEPGDVVFDGTLGLGGH